MILTAAAQGENLQNGTSENSSSQNDYIRQQIQALRQQIDSLDKQINR